MARDSVIRFYGCACMCVCMRQVCACVCYKHMCSGACEGQKKASDPPVLEFQAADGFLT